MFVSPVGSYLLAPITTGGTANPTLKRLKLWMAGSLLSRPRSGPIAGERPAGVKVVADMVSSLREVENEVCHPPFGVPGRPSSYPGWLSR